MPLSTKKIENFSIEQNLKALRNIRDLSLSDFAREIYTTLSNVKNYEQNETIPSIEVQRTITSKFGISTDFLLLWDNTPYTHSTKLMNLAVQIDSEDYRERFQIEGTASSLMLNINKSDLELKEDTVDIELTSSFHENIKLLRNKHSLSMQSLADKIGVSKTQIIRYERSSFPRVDGLIKLSELFNISIHALLTGEKLKYDFKDQHLEETILKADKLLSLKDKDFLIHLMEKIIENSD